MPATNLKLPAPLERFVEAQVRSGIYRSRNAAIVAAVSFEKRRAEQRTWLQSALQKGLDSGIAGELDVADILLRSKKRRAARARRARSQ